VQAADDIEPGTGGLFHDQPPLLRYGSANRGDPDQKAANSRLCGLFDGHIRYAEVDAATWKTQLASNQFRPPLDDTQACFGIGRVTFFANQYQVRRLQADFGPDGQCLAVDQIFGCNGIIGQPGFVDGQVLQQDFLADHEFSGPVDRVDRQ